MKTIRRVSYVLLSSILIGWLIAGCSHSPTEPSPQTTCRIQQYVSTSISSGLKTIYQINYEYDQPGNLTKLVTTFDKRSVGATTPIQTIVSNVVYTYDTEGYLTASTSQEKNTIVMGSKTTIEQVSVVSSYSYTNGRLASSHTRRLGAYGVNTTTTESYEYDNSGALVKKTAQSLYDYDPAVATEIPSSPTGPLQIWTYQKNQLTDYVEKSGTTEFRPLTIQNGVVTKASFPGAQGDYVATYEYDSQQRPTKWEEYIGGILNRTYTQTWSEAKPSSATLGNFKGWPLIGQEYGRAGVLVTNKSFSLNTATKQMQEDSEQTSVIQTNSQGFVTDNSITIKRPNPASTAQDNVTTETYTYSGCQ